MSAVGPHIISSIISSLVLVIGISASSLSHAWTGGTEVATSMSWDKRQIVAFSKTYGTGHTRSREQGALRATSRECLSCHDGSSAPNRLDDVGFNSWSSKQAASFGLMEGHPVAVRYNAPYTRSRVRLFDPTTTPSGLGGSIAEDLLIDSKVECSSCHSPHDAFGRGSTLRISNSGSTLCFTCHDL